MTNSKKIIVIVGGGAAGFFAAVTCAESNPNVQVILLEQGKEVLSKVRISGGGRCNVCHACFEPKELVKNYPRGSKELLGPFHHFASGDTMEWFESRGVDLKIEDDGRVFPVSDDSASIVQCLISSAKQANVKILTQTKVKGFTQLSNLKWQISVNEDVIVADTLMIATGSSRSIWNTLISHEYNVIPDVPSLFTFNTKDTRLRDLAGISVPHSKITLSSREFTAEGPLLITHWGLSGPAILRLSAWGARHLEAVDYKFTIEIDWCAANSEDDILEYKQANGGKKILANPLFLMPTRLWKSLLSPLNMQEKNWAELSKVEINAIIEALKKSKFNINGKSTFKEEFVTAGGIDLKQIDFKTFGSKSHKNLYFAGEVLDVDAITGGFNFQAAWTGGYLAGKAMAIEEN